MAITLKLKRSAVSTSVPTTANLADGEVATNVADKKIYQRVGSTIHTIANFFSGAWTDITGKPTTVSGYNITDAVTTGTVQAITGAKTFSAPMSFTSWGNSHVDFGATHDIILTYGSTGSLTARTYDGTTYSAQQTIWHAGNLNPGDYVPTSRNLAAGDGLTGGGTLSANRTFTLGTPSAVTIGTTNTASGTTHTHALSLKYSPTDANTPATSYPGENPSVSLILSDATWPVSAGSALTVQTDGGGNRVFQLFSSTRGGSDEPDLYLRSSHTLSGGGGWTAFRQIWHEGNFTPTSKADDSAVVKLTGTQTIGGVKTFTESVTVAAGAQTGRYILSTAPGEIGDFVWQASGVDRWTLRCTNSVESGSNTGSDFRLQARADNGSALHNVFDIVRATGVMNFNVAPTITNEDIWHTGNFDPNAVESASTASGGRLGPYAKEVTDWNNAIETGVYKGNTLPNAPLASGWFMGFVEAYASTYVTQTLYQFTADSNTDTRIWRRSCTGGTWEAWYRVRISEDEQNASLGTESITASTLARRTSQADLQARLFRSSFADQATITGAMAFRVSNGADNYIRFCNSPTAVRGWLGAVGNTSGVASVRKMTQAAYDALGSKDSETLYVIVG